MSPVDDLWFLGKSDTKPTPYVPNGHSNSQAQVSPNGRYIAYATDEDGKDQIVVRPFPVPGVDRWQVTAHGGTQPVWKRDGRELYYLAPDGKLMAVSVTTDPTFQAGQTSTLFETSLTPQPLPLGHSYAVSGDGQQFLLANASSPVSDSSSITVVVNWPAALRRK